MISYDNINLTKNKCKNLVSMSNWALFKKDVTDKGSGEATLLQ